MNTNKVIDPRARFTGRADVYQDNRPRYPEILLDILIRHCGLTLQSFIADVGAGTGLLTGLFLRRGYRVVAVEPNSDMRAICSQMQTKYSNLECVDANAEETGLPEHSIDLITVGQAIHWFDCPRTRKEFSRILRVGGWIALVENDRCVESNLFHSEYESILREYGGADYSEVKSRHLSRQALEEFFAPSDMTVIEIPNEQKLDREGLAGRIVSSSYMPPPDHARYSAMCSTVDALFNRHQQNGFVRLEYVCRVHLGCLE